MGFHIELFQDDKKEQESYRELLQTGAKQHCRAHERLHKKMQQKNKLEVKEPAAAS